MSLLASNPNSNHGYTPPRADYSEAPYPIINSDTSLGGLAMVGAGGNQITPPDTHDSAWLLAQLKAQDSAHGHELFERLLKNQA